MRNFPLIVALMALSPACGFAADPPAPAAQPPLRLFIRGGPKDHGPGQHDHPRFLKEWTELLNQRGAATAGGMEFPTADQLANTDVLILYAANAGKIAPEDRKNLDAYLARGGGIVVIHDGICSDDPEWFKTIVGGAWEWKVSKYEEGSMHLYFQDHDHPITKGVSNFDMDDEIYWDLRLDPAAHVLANSFRNVFEIKPQMWVYEKNNYRAFVMIQGHTYTNFALPHFRALLLRGIAWTGKRDGDVFLTDAEKASLHFPRGGPTPPERGATKIQLQAGFEMSLVAAEPLINKPISMDWDRAGRLWVAETPEYPSHADASRPPQDRVSILSDPDASGRYQKKTVFADGLNLVTSLVFYKDGVIVSQAPQILWLRDTTGSGICDKRQVLFTGFGNNDTHALVSNLRWGADGWIYATVGYSAGHPKSGDRSKDFGSISSGVIRFKPDGSAIEQVSSKGGNTWGCDFDWDNELFFSQANGAHVNHVVLPERYLARGKIGSTSSYKNIQDHHDIHPIVTHKEQTYEQYDWIGDFTAAAGCTMYTGGAWPAEFNGSYFVSEPTVHILHRDVLKPDAATGNASFTASRPADESASEFIAGSDLWFRPIHTRIGPDGAMYLVDFYNQAILHNDPRRPPHGPGNAAVRPDRDHEFGRIWRIQSKQAITLPTLDLANATPAQLVAALEHPNRWQRITAQRALVDAGDISAVGDLEKLAIGSKLAYARIHALWTLHELGKLTPPDLTAAMSDPQPAVRKNACWILADQPSAGDAAVWAAVLKCAADQDARARLAALEALTGAPASGDVAQHLVNSFSDLKDPWSQSAVIAIAASSPAEFIGASLDVKDPTAVTPLVNALGGAVALNPEAAGKVIALLAAKPASADGAKAAILGSINATLAAAPDAANPAWSAELQNALRSLIQSPNESVAGAAIPLAARWDAQHTLAGELGEVAKQMKASLADATKPDEQRIAAGKALIGLRQGDPQALPAVVKQLTAPAASIYLRSGLIEALGEVSDVSVGAQLVAAYPQLPPQIQAMALGQILQRPERAMALVDAIERGKVTLSAIGPEVTYRLRTHPNREVAQRAVKVIEAIRGPEMKEKNTLIDKFFPIVEKPGDAINGKAMFTKNCLVCHAFKGEGRGLAPDLNGMGAHGPLVLLTKVLDPNRSVEGNYVAYDIDTKDGHSYTGVIAQENASSVLLRTATEDIQIKTANIKRRHTDGRTLMPEGFEVLGPEVIRDIITYISADQLKYRVIDLASFGTANTLHGIFSTEASSGETLAFAKFGTFIVDGVPYDILHPSKTPAGRNIILLRGGPAKTMSRKYPVKVEIPVALPAAKLHLISGVGGWAYPGGEKDAVVLKLTLYYEDGKSQTFEFQNGKEFADYNGDINVPGSKAVPGLMAHGQVRQFSITPNRSNVKIKSLLLESLNNGVVPVVVAITVELPEASAKPPGK